MAAPLPGSIVAFPLPAPVQGFSHVAGLLVASVDQDSVVAVPEAATVGRRLSVTSVDGGRVWVIYAIVSTASLVRFEDLPTAEILRFATPPIVSHLVSTYQEAIASETSAASALSTPAAPPILPSSTAASRVATEAPQEEWRTAFDSLRSMVMEQSRSMARMEETLMRGPVPAEEAPQRAAAASSRVTWQGLLGESDGEDEGETMGPMPNGGIFGGAAVPDAALWGPPPHRGPPAAAASGPRLPPPARASQPAAYGVGPPPMPALPWSQGPAASLGPGWGPPPPPPVSSAGGSDTLAELVRLLKAGKEDDVFGEKESSGTKGLAAVHRMRAEVKKNPDKVVSQYLEEVKQQLGVTNPQQYWHLRDWTRRNASRFGRMRALLRIHYYLSEVIGCILEGQTAYGVALAVQAQKAILQTALDQGSWDASALIWPMPDPIGAVEFAASESEMQAVYAYKKALGELRVKSRQTDAGAGDLEEAGAAGSGPTTAAPKSGRKPKGGGKGAAPGGE